VSRAVRTFDLTVPQQSEHDLQIDCTNMLWRVLLPDISWSAYDHGHSFDKTIGRHGRPIGLLEMQKRKARGVKAGIPDYQFLYQGDTFAIELKASADAPLSDDQKAFLTSMIKNGAQVAICWTIWQVFNKVLEWGLCRPGVRVMT
jgi:hypothetical protein